MRVTALLFSVALVLFAFGSAFGQSITIDNVQGLNANGNIDDGATLTFNFRITGDADVHYVMSNGFSFAGNNINWGGATGTLNPAYKWDLNFGFPCMFDLGFFINYFSVDGIGADTVGFGGAAGMYGTGLPAGFDDIGWWIEVGPVHGDPGAELVLDSAFYPPAGYWLWDVCEENVAWGGPYVYSIESPCIPPTITSTPVTDGVIGVEYVYNVVATGDPAPVFALTVAPEGMLIAPDGAITWTPSAAGDYNVTVTATNDCAADEQSFVITVPEPLVAPVITSTAVTDGVVGDPYAYDVDATGNPAPTFALTVAPDGMTINATTGLIEWTPDATGDFDVTVEAANSEGTDAQSFVVSVTPALVAPYFTSTAVTDGVVGEAYVYDADAEGYPTPTYELTTAPSGMTIDEVTGVVNWTPGATGDFDVTIRATNGVNPAATQSYVISVVPAPEAPVITSTPVVDALVGQPYSYDVNASGYPAPTYELTISPAGMTINAVSGLIEWTPAAAGDYDVTVVATNASGDDTQSFTIHVPDEPYTDCWPQPTILKALENDRILDIRIYNENPDNVDQGTIRVQGNIPPYTGVRVEDGVIITDAFIMRFLGASGFRPVTGDFTETYTVEYDKFDGTHPILTGDYALQVNPGDVTLDGITNTDDIVFMVEYLWTGGEITNMKDNSGKVYEIEELMDVDNNGRIDVRDLREIISLVY